ncbi:MAG TPA: DUF2239 family protein [Microvirga sp.]|jgi:hypothetical protein
MTTLPSHTAFNGQSLLARGTLSEVAVAVKRAVASNGLEPITVIEDRSGRPIDLDLRGTEADIAARYDEIPAPSPARGRGRPRLGVVAREVTLLPRHWDWLATQPGGASVTLRRLIDDARRSDAGEGDHRARRDAAYTFMAALGGDLPGFEEGARALYAGDRAQLESRIAAWPADLRDHALRLAYGE